ncbi:MAG: helix-turn-helix domain-containing protein [Hydrogenophaga sp.]|uniref:helix-turn-helix domain-containing protein n=1 Tax=Hydrogenophaga sp. TaxID=1904254 RepID=UPI002616D9E8|nr:helix-turn-helix domain-containing protein [Hydrogenophaga sp.]MCW5669400.1 helix-turn-helix domain-containing protein [Hydrogenophaga sp.]
MSALPIAEAAQVLGVPPGTLRRWCREQRFPVAQAGRRGRGCALLVDPEVVRKWRGADKHDALILELAQAIPDLLAAATEKAFIRIENEPAKRRLAGYFTAAWFQLATAVQDTLRERCASVPEVRMFPEAIKRLQKIAKGD